LQQAHCEQAGDLFAQGLKPSDVAQQLGISRATAFRYQKQWKEESQYVPDEE
jgi:hypothetical protein